MQRYVVLLRGINVGGNNPLPMKQFRDLLSSLGCEDVATYIQSGNAVFGYENGVDDLRSNIATRIEAESGFRPSVMIRSREDFEAIVAGNPFAVGEFDPKMVHAWILGDIAVDADTAKMKSVASVDERFLLTDSAFYLQAPSGIGRSKLASAVEKLLAVTTTARNWRTMTKIAEMLKQ